MCGLRAASGGGGCDGDGGYNNRGCGNPGRNGKRRLKRRSKWPTSGKQRAAAGTHAAGDKQRVVSSMRRARATSRERKTADRGWAVGSERDGGCSVDGGRSGGGGGGGGGRDAMGWQ